MYVLFLTLVALLLFVGVAVLVIASAWIDNGEELTSE